MRLELRGLLLDLVPDFAVEEHEGREALLGHLCLFLPRRRRLGTVSLAARGSLCGAWRRLCSLLAVSAACSTIDASVHAM